MIDPLDPNYASTPISPSRARFGYARRAGVEAMPSVSIVTPWYNAGEVFHETAACLLGKDARSVRVCSGQSLQNFEWIIVNDGSTDPASLDVLGQYRDLAKRDSRIRIIDHPQNRGLPAARNTGWRAARSGLVFFLDADDLIEPTTLEKCAMHLACNLEFGFVKGQTVGFGAIEYLWTRGFHEGREMLSRNVVTATAMVRKSVLERAGGFDETMRGGMEDWALWIQCAANGDWGETIPEFLDWYRRRDAGHAAWADIADENRRVQVRDGFAERCPTLASSFPQPMRAWHMPYASIGLPLADRATSIMNALEKESPRAMLLVGALGPERAAQAGLDLLKAMRKSGWETTVVGLQPGGGGGGAAWTARFSAITPDVFDLGSLARMPQMPAMLDHLLGSRRPDVLVISDCELAYLLLPYLRARHPGVAVVDMNHRLDPQWRGGGYPRFGAGQQDQVDLSLAASDEVRAWMVHPDRGADPERTRVCPPDASKSAGQADESWDAPDGEFVSRLHDGLQEAIRLHRERPRAVVTERQGRELAVQGLELLRLQGLADELWAYREIALELKKNEGHERIVEREPTPLLFGGSRRSGTTWLSSMLNAHPEIECRNEGWMFNDLGPRGGASLPLWLDRERFLAWARGREARGTWLKHMSPEEAETIALRGIWRAITREGVKRERWKDLRRLKYVGDKTTAHYLTQIEDVYRVFPDARFLHMLRDGRDVVVSDMFLLLNELDRRVLPADARREAERVREERIVRKNRDWPLFGPAVLRHLIGDWIKAVAGARRAREVYGESFCEVRYERIVEIPRDELERVLRWLGVEVTGDVVDRLLQSHTFEKLSGGRKRGEEDPTAEWRKGVAGDWVNHFSDDDKRVFKAMAGELLIELGYARDLAW